MGQALGPPDGEFTRSCGDRGDVQADLVLEQPNELAPTLAALA